MIRVDDSYVENLKVQGLRKPRLNTLYSMSRIFREVYRIPAYIPVSYVCFLEHGVNFQFEHFYNRLLESHGEIIFLDNSHRVANYEARTGKKAYALGPLYPKYRKAHDIRPLGTASGTLAFPSHSSSEFDFSSGYSRYAQDLLQLPERFHPITVCVYYYDLLQGRHKVFEEAGFEVVTNGYIGDEAFVDTFYDTMRRFRYITSNHIGSYSYYALEMGLPFFLYGPDTDKEFIGISDLNGIDMKQYLSAQFYEQFKAAVSIGLPEEPIVTEEQKRLIAIIEDEKNTLPADIVRRIVKKGWIYALVKKLLKKM